MGVEKGGDIARALGVLPKLDEVPAFAAVHGRVGNALKQVRALLHRREELAGLAPNPVDVGGLHVKIQPVDLFPHLAADQLAHLAGIFTRHGHMVGDGGAVFFVEGQEVGDVARLARQVFRRGDVQAGEKRFPRAGHGGR